MSDSKNAIAIVFTKPEARAIMSIISKLEKTGLLKKGNTAKCMCQLEKQRGGFIGTLLAGLAGSLLPALLGGKGIKRAGKGIKRAGKGIKRAGKGIKRSGHGIMRAGQKKTS